MRKGKRGGGDLTRNFHKNRKVCKTGWVSGRLRDKDSTQDVCTKLSDMVKSDFCRSVVSISLCNGNICLFSCSGIAIARHGYRLTRFLTSASVVRAFNGKTSEHYFDLKCAMKAMKCTGVFLAEYDLVRNFAVVDVCDFLDVDVGILDRALKSVPHGEACVVGRGVSGDLMARSVELGGDLLRIYKDDKYNSKTTSKAWEGGAIVSFDGEVVGMNLFLATEIAVFLPWGTILKRLEFYWKSWEKETGLARSESLVYGFGASVGGKSNSHPEEHLNQEDLDIDSMGYPKLPSTGAGMILVNTFEETFGDICGKGVWSKFSEKASASISRNVVALASFKGEKRFFACTGFFIRWNGSTKILTSASLIRNSCDENKIVENLRIEVSLPCNKCTQGTVVHSDLHYNIAIVSVENRRGLRPANTLLSWTRCFQVAAVGRCFESGALMATSGKLISSTGTLDCDFLAYSSCKITKVGIGGPLVNLDGDVLGMNFYDKKIGTPFLLWPDICKVLASFEKKSKAGDPSGAPFWKMDGDDRDELNRWPVPMPCWRLPENVDEKSDDDDGLGHKYCYMKGKKFVLL